MLTDQDVMKTTPELESHIDECASLNFKLRVGLFNETEEGQPSEQELSEQRRESLYGKIYHLLGQRFSNGSQS